MALLSLKASIFTTLNAINVKRKFIFPNESQVVQNQDSNSSKKDVNSLN